MLGCNGSPPCLSLLCAEDALLRTVLMSDRLELDPEVGGAMHLYTDAYIYIYIYDITSTIYIIFIFIYVSRMDGWMDR